LIPVGFKQQQENVMHFMGNYLQTIKTRVLMYKIMLSQDMVQHHAILILFYFYAWPISFGGELWLLL